jgi:hypothetical protein
MSSAKIKPLKKTKKTETDEAEKVPDVFTPNDILKPQLSKKKKGDESLGDLHDFYKLIPTSCLQFHPSQLSVSETNMEAIRDKFNSISEQFDMRPRSIEIARAYKMFLEEMSLKDNLDSSVSKRKSSKSNSDFDAVDLLLESKPPVTKASKPRDEEIEEWG